MSPELPRFIPTLTEVVEPRSARHEPAPGRNPEPPSASLLAPQAQAPAAEDAFAEQIAHRVLQRVDAGVEDELSEAIRLVVARQVEAMLPALREQIVATVQRSVANALAAEFAASPGDRSAP
ncbi:hypothetical protein [Xylophilus sp. GOD-11R]|uniref:hypothetical protein n=1 Tax=Xylophilus sp. GOD-11R TaxID=3089814 RepID=UPI00298BD327|nr:hypothetical protein [Xylophilus sp. GOD-11R]WPB59271.1 hypothetical protein R9X41_11745 [Xylophilus sp. GOD-11R]